MIVAVLGALLSGAVISFAATWIAIRLGNRAGALDGAGVEGQVKAAARRVPNTGGIGIACGIVLPLLVAGGVAAAGVIPERVIPSTYADGLAHEWMSGVVVLLGLLVVHAMGLLDDRRPLSWAPKLILMLAVPAGVAWMSDTRVLSAFDAVVGGAWLSVGITALWFAAVMNAVNFMDNMDGLAGGTAAVIALGISAVASVQEQWFVAGTAACVAGASLGFLPWNFPRARVFMGDGGSLVLGFALAFLATRLTYVDSTIDEPRWDRLVIPFILLSVPLYDMASVIVLRIGQGRSPFVGDLQHMSHRFEGRGLSRPSVSLAVWALALISGLGAVVVALGSPLVSLLIGLQTTAAMGLLAIVERGMPWRQP